VTQPSPRQSLLFSRTLDGLEEWMEEVEGKLQSRDHGSDLSSTQTLLKRHHKLQEEVQARGKEVRQREDGGCLIWLKTCFKLFFNISYLSESTFM